MNDATESTSGLAARHSLGRWVDEMQEVVKEITNLIAESDRHRADAESTQREVDALRDGAAKLGDETARLRAEAVQLRAEVEQYRGVAEAVQREGEDLRQAVAALQAENDRLRGEQAEAGETAAKLLGEMKELVNQVAHKFQGTPRISPFAREPKSPSS